MIQKRVILLGATGSIGRQTMEVAEAFPDRFEIVGLAANSDLEGLLAASSRFPKARLALAASVSKAMEQASKAILHGSEGILELVRATDADIVVNGIAGAAGLPPSIAALESGKNLALANKESVVMAYCLLEASAAASGAAILPVDSEHAALFQLLRHIPEAEELILTASGGAFRDRPLASLAKARPDEAAAHPSWKMGRKISIDSATMANKGLEVIEASRLFHMEAAKVKVLIHPQSIVHALVRSTDGSLYANMSFPDMRLPILSALNHPEPMTSPFGRLDLAGLSLEFREAAPERYPLVGLAYEALARGYGATIAYNAADEIAVAAFERGEIGYLDLSRLVEACIALDWPAGVRDLRDVLEMDRAAREASMDLVKEFR